MHLVHGDSAAATVAHNGVPSDAIRVFKDLLTVGPCDEDPARHRTLRSAYWHTGAWPREAALPPDAPLIVWATLAWSDQLFLWWLFDAFERDGVDLPRLSWAQPHAGERFHASVGGVSAAALSEALAQARPVSPAQLAQGASLWRKYAAESPLAFDEARRAGSPSFPELARTAEVHGVWFPRRVGVRLRLAAFDELILSTLNEEWRTPSDLLRTDPGQHIPDRFFLPFGDLFFLRRLRDWADHGILKSEDRGGDSAFSAVAYRREASGRRLVEEGLKTVADAPPLYVGGCHVNNSAEPWVRIDDGDDWRLARG